MRALGRLLRFLFVCAVLALSPSAPPPSAGVVDTIACVATAALVARTEAAAPKAEAPNAPSRQVAASTSARRERVSATSRAPAAARRTRAPKTDLYLVHCALLC